MSNARPWDTGRRLVIDLDGVICFTDGEEYEQARPNFAVIERIRELYAAGWRIIIDTARGSGSGIDWSSVVEGQLAAWDVPYHGIRCGEKPWATLYVDDRAIRPDEFLAGVEAPIR